MSKLICPNCGAPWPPDAAGRVVCEYCGSLLASEEPRRGTSYSQGPAIREPPIGSEAAELPDWMREMAVPPEREQVWPEGTEWRSGTAYTHRPGVPRRRRRSRVSCVAGFVFILVACLVVWSAFSAASVWLTNSSEPDERRREVAVSAQEGWQSTGLDVRPGQMVTITYLRGTWGVWGGPEGVKNQADAEGFVDEYRPQGPPLPSAPLGALLGRVGDGRPFLVGRGTRFRAGVGGVLSLRINDQWLNDNTGALHVAVVVEAPG